MLHGDELWVIGGHDHNTYTNHVWHVSLLPKQAKDGSSSSDPRKFFSFTLNALQLHQSCVACFVDAKADSSSGPRKVFLFIQGAQALEYKYEL